MDMCGAKYKITLKLSSEKGHCSVIASDIYQLI